MKKLLLLSVLQFVQPTNVWLPGSGDLQAIWSPSVYARHYNPVLASTGGDTVLSEATGIASARADIENRVSRFAGELCNAHPGSCQELLEKYKLRWRPGSALDWINPAEADYGQETPTGKPCYPSNPFTPRYTWCPLPAVPVCTPQAEPLFGVPPVNLCPAEPPNPFTPPTENPFLQSR